MVSKEKIWQEGQMELDGALAKESDYMVIEKENTAKKKIQPMIP